MSLFTGWLIALLMRWMRGKKGRGVSDRPILPAWPRGASLKAELHDGRGFRPSSDETPEMLSISLRRDSKTGRIYDCSGRELVSVEIRGAGKKDFRRDPAGILQALSTESLAGQVITLLLVDDSAFTESADSFRMGLHFVDATCIWVESANGFEGACVEPEFTVA